MRPRHSGSTFQTANRLDVCSFGFFPLKVQGQLKTLCGPLTITEYRESPGLLCYIGPRYT